MNLLASGSMHNLLGMSQGLSLGMSTTLLASSSAQSTVTQGAPTTTHLIAESAPHSAAPPSIMVRTTERVREISSRELAPALASALMMTGCSTEAQVGGIFTAVLLIGAGFLWRNNIINWGRNLVNSIRSIMTQQTAEPTPAPRATEVRLPIHELEKRPVQHHLGIGRRVTDGSWRINPEKTDVHDKISDLHAVVRILPDYSYWIIDNESEFGLNVIRDGKVLKVSPDRYLKLEPHDVIEVFGIKLLRHTGSNLLGLESVEPDMFESAPDYPLPDVDAAIIISSAQRSRPIARDLESDVMLGYFTGGTAHAAERETQIRRIQETRVHGAIADLTATIAANNLGEQKALLDDALAAYQDLDLLITHELAPDTVNDDRLLDLVSFEDSIRSRLNQLRSLRDEGVNHYITSQLPTDAHQNEAMVVYSDMEAERQNVIREAAIQAWERLDQEQRDTFWEIEGRRGARLPLAYLRLFFTTWESHVEHDDSGSFVIKQGDRVLQMLPLLHYVSQHSSEAVRALVHHPSELVAAFDIFGYFTGADKVVQDQFWGKDDANHENPPAGQVPVSFLDSYFGIRTRRTVLGKYPVAHQRGLRSDFHDFMSFQVRLDAFREEILLVGSNDVFESQEDPDAAGEAAPIPLSKPVAAEPPPLPDVEDDDAVTIIPPPSDSDEALTVRPPPATPPRGRRLRRQLQRLHDSCNVVYQNLPEDNRLNALVLAAMSDLIAARDKVLPEQQSDIGIENLLDAEQMIRVGEVVRAVRALEVMSSFKELVASDEAIRDWDHLNSDDVEAHLTPETSERVGLVAENKRLMQLFTIDHMLYGQMIEYNPSEASHQELRDSIAYKWEKIPALRRGATEMNEAFVLEMTEIYLAQHPDSALMIKGAAPKLSREEKVEQILATVDPEWDSYDSRAQYRAVDDIFSKWARPSYKALRRGASEIDESFVRMIVTPPRLREDIVADIVAEVLDDWADRDLAGQRQAVKHFIGVWDRQPALRGGASEINPRFITLMQSSLPAA